jgi:hypothetical protein
MIPTEFKFTQSQILGLIPAQAILDYERAKDVLEKAAQAQRLSDLKWFVKWLEEHRIRGKAVNELKDKLAEMKSGGEGK